MSDSNEACVEEDAVFELYAHHRRELEEGRGVDLETFCARHPDEAEALRALDRDRRAFEELDQRLNLLPRRAAEAEASAVSLQAGLLSVDDTQVNEELARLGAESPAAWPYQDLSPVGNGAFGIVYRARQDALRRTVALKTLRSWRTPEACTPEERRQQRTRLARFLAETQILAQLDHPGIVPLYAAGADDRGRPYFTMRLVRGRDFSQVIRAIHAGEEEWTLGRGLEVLLHVCDTVSYAHSRRVLHRDLKPDNVRVGRFGEVYVMDWGLASVVDPDRTAASVDGGEHSGSVETFVSRPSSREDSARLSLAGTVIGSPSYMAPEQAHGERVDSRADVYALGAMLYHLLAGHPPYQRPGRSSTWQEIVTRAQQEPPEPLGERRPDLAPELIAITERAMARDPEQRYATVGRLAADLRAFLDGRVVSAYASGRFHELRSWVRRNRALAGAMLAAAASLVLGLGLTATVLAVKNRQIRATETLYTGRDAKMDDALRQVRLFSHEENGGYDTDKGAQIGLVDALDNTLASGVFGDDDPEFEADNLVPVGVGRMGQGRLVTARRVFEEALALLEPRAEHGLASDPAKAEATRNRALLGLLYVEAFDRRITPGRRLVERLQDVYSERDVDRADLLMAASILEHNAGRLERAREYVGEALEILEEVAHDREAQRALDPGLYLPRIQTGAVRAQHANVELRLAREYGDRDLMQTAIRHAELVTLEARDSFERALAEVMLARGALVAEDYALAEEKARSADRRLRLFSGDDSVHTLHLGSTLAEVLVRRGLAAGDDERVEEGLGLLREALAKADRNRESAGNAAAARLHARLAQALARCGRVDEALAAYAAWSARLEADDFPELGLEHMRVKLEWARLLLTDPANADTLEQAHLRLAEAQVLARRFAELERTEPRVGPDDRYAWHPGELTFVRALEARAAGDTAAEQEALAALRAELAERPDARRQREFEQALGLPLGD